MTTSSIPSAGGLLPSPELLPNIRLSEAAKYTLDSPNYVPLVAPATLKKWHVAQQSKLKPLQDELAAATNETEQKKLSKQMEE